MGIIRCFWPSHVLSRASVIAFAREVIKLLCMIISACLVWFWSRCKLEVLFCKCYLLCSWKGSTVTDSLTSGYYWRGLLYTIVKNNQRCRRKWFLLCPFLIKKEQNSSANIKDVQKPRSMHVAALGECSNNQCCVTGHQRQTFYVVIASISITFVIRLIV